MYTYVNIGKVSEEKKVFLYYFTLEQIIADVANNQLSSYVPEGIGDLSIRL
jgi:hypothetical protein